MELIDLFFAFTGGCLWLLSFLFLMNISGVNVIANRWLGAFYFCLGSTFIQLFIEGANFNHLFPLHTHLLELLRWATLPCFYIAILYFVKPTKKSIALLLHFVPAFLFLLFSFICIIPHIFNPAHTLSELPVFARLFLKYFFMAQTIIYWSLSFAELLKHTRNIRLLSSSIEKIDLRWLRYTLLGVFLMTVVLILSRGSQTISAISPAIYFFGVASMSYFSLKQGVIYPVPARQLPDLENILKKKPVSERLTQEQVDVFKAKVVEVTKKEKLYLDPGLTLPALAERLGFGRHELSYVLNSGLSRNFYKFINEMRVEEAKSLLASGEATQLDMIGIATYAGFNSKTTFNTTFKKITGCTPTEFLKTQLNAKESQKLKPI